MLQLSDKELEVMNVIWENGIVTVNHKRICTKMYSPRKSKIIKGIAVFLNMTFFMSYLKNID